MQREQHPPQQAFSQEDVVRFYRELGFFKGGALSECADRLLKRFEHDHGEPLDPRKVWDDVYLLSYYKENVWADDPECDVCAGNEVYRDVLARWSSISKGFFDVEDIEEMVVDVAHEDFFVEHIQLAHPGDARLALVE